jgi:hypothetical protein
VFGSPGILKPVPSAVPAPVSWLAYGVPVVSGDRPRAGWKPLANERWRELSFSFLSYGDAAHDVEVILLQVALAGQQRQRRVAPPPCSVKLSLARLRGLRSRCAG